MIPKLHYVKVPIIIGVIAVLVLALSTNYLVGSVSNVNLVYAQDLEEIYFADLSGDSEVPTPISTQATGFATFEFGPDISQLSYVVNVSNIDNVIAAHIHQGNENENGPIVLTLYNGSGQELPEGDLTGILTADNATSTDLEGPLAGEELTNLIGVINEGTAYVNVHTVDFPDGEIRGTIVNASLFESPSIPPPGSVVQPPLEPSG